MRTNCTMTRLIRGIAAANRASAGAAAQPRLLRAGLCSAQRAAEPFWFPRNLSNPLGLSGGVSTRFLSSAASSVAHEVRAPEPPQSVKFKFDDVVLYQYEACPFCNKVKAFLDYYKIPYKVVEVNPISKKEIKWSEYKKVPILKVDGEQMVDSSGNFSFMERVVAKYTGAAAMYFVSKKLKKRHNITDERGALYEAAETWVNTLKNRPYCGGVKPNLADLAVFGVLRPIRHLQSGKDMVGNTRIGDWYSRMERSVGDSARIMA